MRKIRKSGFVAFSKILKLLRIESKGMILFGSWNNSGWLNNR